MRTLLRFALLSTLACAINSSANGLQAAEATEVCSHCHGSQGISAAAHIPNLAGQKQAYLEAQLSAFQQGKRTHEVMGPIARQLSERQRARLAAHFAAMPASPAAASAAATAKKLSASPFPPGFPGEFRTYLDSREGNIRKLVWANLAALNAARAGQPLPDGSAIVVENRRIDSSAADKGTRPADSRETVTGYAVMQSEAGWGDEVPDMLRNGNWRYAMFDGERKARDKAPLAECLACHKAKASESYVFSLAGLREYQTSASTHR